MILATLPLFHVTGMQSNMNAPILVGATIVMIQRWDREAAADLIESMKTSSWTCITTMASGLLSMPGIDKRDLSSLRRLGGGGAAMPAAVAARLQSLTGPEYIEGYGMTETIAPTHLNPNARPKRQCAGVPLFDVDARVIDPDTLSERGVGESGEIVVHAPQVFLGYWNNPRATEAAFIAIDGKRFLRTGDIGHYDHEGYFFITDRLKRMINAAGYKVWPAEVEAMMYAHPDILEACVIAARDERRGSSRSSIRCRARLPARSCGANSRKGSFAPSPGPAEPPLPQRPAPQNRRPDDSEGAPVRWPAFPTFLPTFPHRAISSTPFARAVAARC